MAFVFNALRGRARTALFRQYATARSGIGLSANALIEEAGSFGLSIRRTNALAIIREVEGRVLSRSTIRNVPDRLIPTRRHYAITRLNLQRRFQTIFEVRGRNVLTGEVSKREVSFVSDERMTLEEMKAQLLERAQQNYGPADNVAYDQIVTIEGLERAQEALLEED